MTVLSGEAWRFGWTRIGGIVRVLITGGSGTLGRRLLAERSLSGDELIAPPHRELDITDRERVLEFFDRVRPELVLHCAAVIAARSDDSADHKANTSRVNVAGTFHIAEASAKVGARLVYVSTDFVFDGSKPGGMYREDEVPAPLGYYALTKYAGEGPVAALERSLIVRTSFHADGVWLYPAAFTDRFTSKLPASVLAHELALAAKSDLTGVLHIGGARQSLFDCASKLSNEIRPITMRDAASTDPMPIDTSLDSTRWREAKQRL